VEAAGLKEAIIWLGDMEASRMSIELDCKLVVDDILDCSINQTELVLS
jgi:ribonuclease HI